MVGILLVWYAGHHPAVYTSSCPATITLTGTDACGNSSSVTYSATILTTAPVLCSCPAPAVTVHCASDIPAVAPVTAMDACGTALTVIYQQDDPANTCTNVITRTWTATDCAGNVSSVTYSTTIFTTPPVFSRCPTS